MLVHFDEVLTNFDGEVLRDNQNMGTLGRIVGNALCAPLANDNSTPEDKYKRGKLAEKAFKGGELELEVEQVALIKEWIGKSYPPMVVFQAFDMLEGQRVGLSIEAAEKQVEGAEAE